MLGILYGTKLCAAFHSTMGVTEARQLPLYLICTFVKHTVHIFLVSLYFTVTYSRIRNKVGRRLSSPSNLP